MDEGAGRITHKANSRTRTSLTHLETLSSGASRTHELCPKRVLRRRCAFLRKRRLLFLCAVTGEFACHRMEQFLIPWMRRRNSNLSCSTQECIRNVVSLSHERAHLFEDITADFGNDILGRIFDGCVHDLLLKEAPRCLCTKS